jgi:PAS domain S-box-containing protein
LVDADLANRSLIGEALRAEGSTLHEVSSVAEALVLVRTRPDLVLLDPNLPDGSGVDLCRKIKADPRTVSTLVVFMSTTSAPLQADALMLEGGADGFLAKPVAPPVVTAQVKAWLRLRRAEEITRAAAQQWRATFDAVRDGICFVDVDGVVARCNRAMADLLGRSFLDIVGRPYRELFEGGAEIEPLLLQTQVQRTGRRQTAEGAWADRWFRVSADPVMDEHGDFTGSVHLFADITERKQAEQALAQLEQQLRQAQKMEAIGQLAGGVAHDFNNLLTIILGYSQIALAQMPLPDPLAAPIEEILKASERAAVLTRQLLAFSRRQVLEPKTLDLNVIVTDMARMLRRLIGEDVLLSTRLSPDLGRVHVDPGQMDQVLLNLAVNARDAMPRGGRLTIETDNWWLDQSLVQAFEDLRPGAYVMLTVSDTGSGIAPEDLPRIFEPFFTTKPPGHGTGLGLSTVYGIVKQSEGHITVDTEAGHGTTFKIYLPRTEEMVSPQPSPAPPLPGRETILVAEDDDSVRQFTGFALRQYGYSVLEADGGAEALRLAEQYSQPIDLLLTDVVMPGMSGRELAHALVQSHPETKVFYFSGYTNDAVVRHGILRAEMPFLQKPFTKEALARKVQEVLRPDAGEKAAKDGGREVSAS